MNFLFVHEQISSSLIEYKMTCLHKLSTCTYDRFSVHTCSNPTPHLLQLCHKSYPYSSFIYLIYEGLGLPTYETKVKQYRCRLATVLLHITPVFVIETGASYTRPAAITEKFISVRFKFYNASLRSLWVSQDRWSISSQSFRWTLTKYDLFCLILGQVQFVKLPVPFLKGTRRKLSSLWRRLSSENWGKEMVPIPSKYLNMEQQFKERILSPTHC